MKLDSEHLEILATIIEAGGLTEGAQLLGKSQPSVSRSMALLEERLGVALFEPGRRPLRPTEFALNLAKFGARLRLANQEASQFVQRYRRGHAGRLRVGGTPIFMDGVISTMIADFQSRHNEVLIDQSYGYAETLTNDLRNGMLDIAILPIDLNEPPPDLDFIPLLPSNNVITCRAGHPLTRRNAISLQDILSYSWIAPPSNSPLFRDLQRALRSIGNDEFRVTFSGGTLASIQSVMTGSETLTVLPYSVVFLSRRTTALEALPLQIDTGQRHLGILTARNLQPPPALKAFSSFLQVELERLKVRMEHEAKITRRRG